MDISEIQAKFDADLKIIRGRYRGDLLDCIHSNIKDVFKDGRICSVVIEQSSQCYNDESYYFGIADVTFYGPGGKRVPFYDDQMSKTYDFIREVFEESSDMFELIFGKDAEIAFKTHGYAYASEE